MACKTLKKHGACPLVLARAVLSALKGKKR